MAGIDPNIYEEGRERRTLDLRPHGVSCIPLLGKSNFQSVRVGTDTIFIDLYRSGGWTPAWEYVTPMCNAWRVSSGRRNATPEPSGAAGWP
jgi:hypothetical protein